MRFFIAPRIFFPNLSRYESSPRPDVSAALHFNFWISSSVPTNMAVPPQVIQHDVSQFVRAVPHLFSFHGPPGLRSAFLSAVAPLRSQNNQLPGCPPLEFATARLLTLSPLRYTFPEEPSGGSVPRRPAERPVLAAASLFLPCRSSSFCFLPLFAITW